MSLAAGIGPVVGGELVRAFGWASVFVVNLPVIAVSVLLAATAGHGRDRAEPRAGRRFDVVGSVLLAAALTALVLGLESAGATGAVLLVASAVLVVPFVWWERRAADPVVAFALFTSVSFTAGSLLVALQNLVMYTLLFELPQVLAALLATDAAATGRLLVSMMAAMIVASFLAGRLTDRVGPRPLAVAGTLTCLAAVAVLAAGDLSSVRELPLPLALLGLGVGLATPAAQTASLAAVPRRYSGAAAGIGSTMRYLGGVVGVALLGRLVDLGGDRSAILAEHRTVLVVFAVALLGAVACAVVLPRGRRPAARPACRTTEPPLRELAPPAATVRGCGRSGVRAAGPPRTSGPSSSRPRPRRPGTAGRRCPASSASPDAAAPARLRPASRTVPASPAIVSHSAPRPKRATCPCS